MKRYTRILRSNNTFQISSNGKSWENVNHVEFAEHLFELLRTGYVVFSEVQTEYQIAITYKLNA